MLKNGKHERLVTVMKLAETAKLTSLIREKTLPKFIVIWKPLIDFLHKMGKNELTICASEDLEEKSTGKGEVSFLL